MVAESCDLGELYILGDVQQLWTKKLGHSPNAKTLKMRIFYAYTLSINATSNIF